MITTKLVSWAELMDKIDGISIPYKVRKEMGWSIGDELILEFPVTGGLLILKKEPQSGARPEFSQNQRFQNDHLVSSN